MSDVDFDKLKNKKNTSFNLQGINDAKTNLGQIQVYTINQLTERLKKDYKYNINDDLYIIPPYPPPYDAITTQSLIAAKLAIKNPDGTITYKNDEIGKISNSKPNYLKKVSNKEIQEINTILNRQITGLRSKIYQKKIINITQKRLLSACLAVIRDKVTNNILLNQDEDDLHQTDLIIESLQNKIKEDVKTSSFILKILINNARFSDVNNPAIIEISSKYTDLLNIIVKYIRDKDSDQVTINTDEIFIQMNINQPDNIAKTREAADNRARNPQGIMKQAEKDQLINDHLDELKKIDDEALIKSNELFKELENAIPELTQHPNKTSTERQAEITLYLTQQQQQQQQQQTTTKKFTPLTKSTPITNASGAVKTPSLTTNGSTSSAASATSTSSTASTASTSSTASTGQTIAQRIAALKAQGVQGGYDSFINIHFIITLLTLIIIILLIYYIYMVKIYKKKYIKNKYCNMLYFIPSAISLTS